MNAGALARDGRVGAQKAARGFAVKAAARAGSPRAG